MSIDKLKRVIWRLQEKGYNGQIRLTDLRRAIMVEIGTDNRTIEINLDKLLELGWIKRDTRYSFHIEGEFKNV